MTDPWRWAEPGLLLADTITKLPPDAAGAVVVSGSHGGRYPGYLAAKAGLRAVVLNDAGIGRDGAGIGSLPYLAALGIAAATVSTASCTIGDAADMATQGTISHANAGARACGVEPGLGAMEAARRLAAAPHVIAVPPPIGETRREIEVADGHRRILLLDSAALVRPEDAGAIVVTGSHGGLVGGDPAFALRVDAVAAVFGDAGRPDGPGATRLPALERRGIAAVTVSAASARIGDAQSIVADGIVSALNATAAACGARLGEPVGPWLAALARIAP